MCCLRLPAAEARNPQPTHWQANGFSPVWERVCALRVLGVTKNFPHAPQLQPYLPPLPTLVAFCSCVVKTPSFDSKKWNISPGVSTSGDGEGGFGRAGVASGDRCRRLCAPHAMHSRLLSAFSRVQRRQMCIGRVVNVELFTKNRGCSYVFVRKNTTLFTKEVESILERENVGAICTREVHPDIFIRFSGTERVRDFRV